MLLALRALLVNTLITFGLYHAWADRITRI
jgi:uncharacterized membrane protein YjgN (DUF898 family)